MTDQEYEEYVVGVIGKSVSLTDLDDYDGLPTAEDVAIRRSRHTNDVIGVWDPDSSEADTARSVVALAYGGVLYRPVQQTDIAQGYTSEEVQPK
jgi:hypothetical protein